jgi:hypothetical protein
MVSQICLIPDAPGFLAGSAVYPSQLARDQNAKPNVALAKQLAEVENRARLNKPSCWIPARQETTHCGLPLP